MTSYIFFNPASGHYSACKLEKTLNTLQRHGISPVPLQVRTPTEIALHCTTISKDGTTPLLIVAGGDGTFNAVVNSLEPDSATLAVLPFGTSNVLAAELGITSIEDGVARIIRGDTGSLSLGVLHMQLQTLRFVLMAGIGLDGAVVRDVNPVAKRMLRQGAYALAAFKNIAAWQPGRFSITAADQTVSCHSIIISNASRYGGNFILSHGNSPLVPGLTATCITGNSRSTYINAAIALVSNRCCDSRELKHITATSFSIAGDKPIQIDGDFVGYAPATVTYHTDFARIII